jgi:pyridoxine 5-phosphate synthase
MASLGVNIDHIANVREARKTFEPDPVTMVLLAELGGADGITVHLREDRRHIQDRDLNLLKETVHTRLNLEMAATEDMTLIALNTKPDMVTLVPEKREEITTEGGLDVIKHKNKLKEIIQRLADVNIPASLFVDPVQEQLEQSAEIKAGWVELHTGKYALTKNDERALELSILKESTEKAKSYGLKVNAGHGLTYQNVEPIAAIKGIEELNIGHTIISRALAVGLAQAVKEMKSLIINPRKDNCFI